MSEDNHTDYTDTIARSAILKAKAAYTCKVHPDILILSGDTTAEKRAYAIAENTLKYNDKVFLLETVVLALNKELDQAVAECPQCAQNLSAQFAQVV